MGPFTRLSQSKISKFSKKLTPSIETELRLLFPNNLKLHSQLETLRKLELTNLQITKIENLLNKGRKQKEIKEEKEKKEQKS